MAFFSDLPPELVNNIFAFVRTKDDQKRVCLVSRAFRDLMAVRLWEWLVSNLCHNDAEMFDVLVHPRSNIIRNIKNFTLNNSDGSYDLTELQRQRFMLFLIALPRDQLFSVESTVRFDSNTFRLLIQAQRNLQDVSVHLSDKGSEAAILLPYLTAVNEISVWIDRDAVQAADGFENYAPLLRQTPRLASLTIGAVSETERSALPGLDADISLIKFPESKNMSGRLDLDNLTLEDLFLGIHHIRITNHINLQRLVSLVLDNCLDLLPLLISLSKSFSGSPCALKDLKITLPNQVLDRTSQVGTCYGVEQLLLSFKGLQSLFLSTSNLALVSKESVINHAQTLETLCIGSGDVTSPQYSVSDLSAILNACDRLEQLGIAIGIASCRWDKLCRTVLVHDTTDPNSSGVPGVQDRLKTIAMHNRLHSLRLMDAPFLDWGRDSALVNIHEIAEQYIEVAAAAIQEFASRIFQNLRKHSSKIRALAWSPDEQTIIAQNLRDSNEHLWPAYAYFRGRMIDAHGTEKVVAIPIGNFEVEMPESYIFTER